MMRVLIVLGLVAVPSATAGARSLDDSLRRLDPEFRAHQACIVLGLDKMRRDKRVAGADRIKTSILSPAQFEGTKVTTEGGAVRAKSHWYALKFTCTVTSDQMKATSFVYEVGKEIPEARWESLGLWR